jgi:hypothetical protein
MRRSSALAFLVVLAAVALLSLFVASRRLSHATRLEAAATRALRRPTAARPLASGAAEERACTELLASSSSVMFMVLGGRGYHSVRVRTILHSWARCVRHVLVFTDPSVNISGYVSERRFVYLSAGDAWRRRPYLPMTHMEALGRLLTRAGSPAAKVAWFFLVTDRTFVDVRALLRLLPPLNASRKGYYGAIADTAHKEALCAAHAAGARGCAAVAWLCCCGAAVLLWRGCAAATRNFFYGSLRALPHAPSQRLPRLC